MENYKNFLSVFRELFQKNFQSFGPELRQPSWLVVQIKLVCLRGHLVYIYKNFVISRRCDPHGHAQKRPPPLRLGWGICIVIERLYATKRITQCTLPDFSC